MDMPDHESMLCSHCNTRVQRQSLLDHVTEELQSQHCSLCSNILQTLTDLLCALHKYGHLKAPVINITCSRCSFKAGSVETFVEHLQMWCETQLLSSESDGVKHDQTVDVSHTSTEQTGFALRECYLPNHDDSKEDKREGGTCEKTVGTSSQRDEKMGDWGGQQFQQMMSMLLTDTSGKGVSKKNFEEDVRLCSKVTIDIAPVCESQGNETVCQQQGMKWEGPREQTSVHVNQDTIGQQCMKCEGYEDQTTNQVKEENNAGKQEGSVDCSHLTNRNIQKTEISTICNNDQYIAANRKRNKTKKAPLKCHLCNYSGQKREDLECHMLETHGKVEYRCYSCNFTAKSPRNLQRHQLVHQRIHPCRYCDFTTRWHNSLVLHEKRHTGEGMMKCDHCDYVTPDKDGLLKHQVKHIGEKPFACGQCDKAFARKCELKRHELRHADVKCAMCHICGDTFRQKQSLVHHIQAQHHGLKVYKCDQCPFETGYNSSLLSHRRAHHTNEKPYRCDFEGCNYASASTSQLKVHRRKHTDNSGLRKHVRRHSTLRPYKCNMCDFDSKHSFLLRKHMETTHNIMSDCKFNRRQLSSMVTTDLDSQNNRVPVDIFNQDLKAVENHGHSLGEVHESIATYSEGQEKKGELHD
ncbi:ZNF845 [Branchiostoma lanceolatum]|uniref:ZNF845 protein n=1 Tax=Branchiostoma lanceolatum TaxID=7740 RepID=A0A8J9ZHE9_BRALA|nr:ZNF845 [Branchiostoma lanceolatum]